MLQIKKLFSNVYVDGSIYLDNLAKPFCVYKEIFKAKPSLFFSVSLFHIKLHDNPICFILLLFEDSIAHVFFPLLYALSRHNESPHIKSYRRMSDSLIDQYCHMGNEQPCVE